MSSIEIARHGLGAIGRLLTRWHRTRRSMAILDRLDDRMLRDIGIARAEIARIAATGCGQDRPNRCSMPRAPATQAEGR